MTATIKDITDGIRACETAADGLQHRAGQEQRVGYTEAVVPRDAILLRWVASILLTLPVASLPQPPPTT